MDPLESITYDELQVGDSATYTRVFTEDALVLFAAVSGDMNPLHLDPGYAQTSVFKERTGHGMWSGALISAAIGTVMPGPGTVYLEQNLRFRKPVRLDDVLNVTLTVTGKEPPHFVIINCEVCNQDQEVVVDGVARVIAPESKVLVERPVLPSIRIGE